MAEQPTLRDWIAMHASEADIRRWQRRAEEGAPFDDAMNPIKGEFISHEQARYLFADAVLAIRAVPPVSEELARGLYLRDLENLALYRAEQKAKTDG